jgi:hypothetical protein
MAAAVTACVVASVFVQAPVFVDGAVVPSVVPSVVPLGPEVAALTAAPVISLPTVSAVVPA